MVMTVDTLSYFVGRCSERTWAGYIFARSKVVHIIISIMKESTLYIILGKVGIFGMKKKSDIKTKGKKH